MPFAGAERAPPSTLHRIDYDLVAGGNGWSFADNLSRLRSAISRRRRATDRSLPCKRLNRSPFMYAPIRSASGSSNRIEFHSRLAESGSRRFNTAGLLLGKGTMTSIEMNARAALYLGSDWRNAKQEGARVFPTAAQAVRFAMEEAAPVSLRGARMVVGDRSYAGNDIAALYRGSSYPFRHKIARKYRPSRMARQLEKLAN